METPEEAHYTGLLNQQLENNLSSVRIEAKTKGVVVWEVKGKHQDLTKAAEETIKIFDMLEAKYGSKTNM